MSTDDSVSEDVSSSGPLSHCHASADGEAGKESEASLVSSEGTSAVSDERRNASQTAGGAVEHRPLDITPACNKIRSLCLSSEDFQQQQQQKKNLPFINPSSLETLRVLVQEIQSSSETDPDIWKDCESRWLHLFQLVEKQYQEQIVAQQEQYQCQIQLIQDEIKALVQIQNRQTAVQPNSDFPPAPGVKPHSKDFLFPLVSSCRSAPHALTPFSSPSPPLLGPDSVQRGEDRVTTMLSSGYGTLSAWESSLEQTGPPAEQQQGGKHCWSTHLLSDQEEAVIGRRQQQQEEEVTSERKCNDTSVYQQKTSSQQQQPLTSWAQRHKLRHKKNRTGTTEDQEPLDQHGAVNPPSSFSPSLKRSDSLISEASGLTYWRLNECDLYRPLPDSFDSGAYLLLQEASLSLTPPPQQEQRLSLREIYHNKQRDGRRNDWEFTSVPSSPQVPALDPSAPTRQSDRTSGFTSPSHFSSPSFIAQPLPSSRVGTPVTPVTPDSMAEGSVHPADTDCTSDGSSVSPAAAGPSPSNLQSSWGNIFHRQSLTDGQQGGASEEELSHTHTSTLKPRSASSARLHPHVERASSLEDPVVLSLLRQNLREKHSRHVADLKNYYESEIQILRDKLRLQELPQDLEKSNQLLTQRCKHLEEALAETTRRVQELEATNSLLEKKLAEWPERYAFAGATVTTLQQRLDDARRSCEEKEATATRLKMRVRQLEEEVQRVDREAQEKEARREREYKMLQDLLAEYDSLTKEHQEVKNKLETAQSKLVDADDDMTQLKRVISKLEVQVKQLQHENQARSRHVVYGNTQPSGAGLFHHPDLLLSPSKGGAEPDVTRHRSPCLPPEPPISGEKSASTSQSHQRSSCSSMDQSSGSWRCVSPPFREDVHQDQRDVTQCVVTPVVRALIQLEETRATEGRAPWVAGARSTASARSTVGFMERRHKESLLQVEREEVKPAVGGATARSGGEVEPRGAPLRAQRNTEGHRSSSLPPPGHTHTSSTPARRKTLQAPVSAKCSPKRCPTDNYSTAFGHMMPREEHLTARTEFHPDRRRHSFHSSTTRKKLHFTSTDRDDEQLDSPTVLRLPDVPDVGVQVCSEDPEVIRGRDLLRRNCEHAALSLAEAERLFDELTREKLQIEAALSRIPGSGSRVTLQTRLDEVSLENRLERLNRELGSLRMTLKRFHILRSSANT